MRKTDGEEEGTGDTAYCGERWEPRVCQGQSVPGMEKASVEWNRQMEALCGLKTAHRERQARAAQAAPNGQHHRVGSGQALLCSPG